jgi:nuclear pore complex protein Nup62
MEEIVNKWTQELESATVEFTRQAAEVAVWDGVLRRGGEEIARLMQSLQAAEERQSSIEQTLDYVEQQQADLTSLLDGYEAQAAELLQGATSNGINAFGSQGVTRSMETGAADAERERAYAMAESLNAQLDELSSNLSSMIVEVNNLSSSTAAARPQAEPDANALGPLRLGSKLHNSGADPVSQIVAILNAHLGSLKWIDESTTALREKVENLRRGQIGGEARASRDRVTSSPSAHRQEGGVNRSNSRNRQSSVAAGGAGSNDTLRSGSVGPGYIRGGSVGRNAGSGWSEATLSTGGGSNLGRSRGYGL